MQTKDSFTPHDMKTSLLEIHSYDAKNPVGTLENRFYDQKQTFSNLTQLLLLVDQLQENLQFPQTTMEKRQFTPSPDPTARPMAPPDADSPLATFQLSIYFRQNASWQGNLIWIEKNTAAQFRSALELTFLLDSVLS